MAVISQFPNRLGVPWTGLLEQAWMGLIGVTLAWTSQLVAQRPSSIGEVTGSPVFQRKMPESCQPPKIASTALLVLLRKVLPFPKGSCQTASALMLWRTSKSELA